MKIRSFKFWFILIVFWFFIVLFQMQVIRQFQLKKDTFSGIIVLYHSKHFLVERNGTVYQLWSMQKEQTARHLFSLDENYRSWDKVKINGVVVPQPPQKEESRQMPIIYVLDTELIESDDLIIDILEIGIPDCGNVGISKIVRLTSPKLIDYTPNQVINYHPTYPPTTFYVLDFGKYVINVPVEHVDVEIEKGSRYKISGFFGDGCWFFCFDINKI